MQKQSGLWIPALEGIIFQLVLITILMNKILRNKVLQKSIGMQFFLDITYTPKAGFNDCKTKSQGQPLILEEVSHHQNTPKKKKKH